MRRVLKENGPVFVILLMVLLVSASVLTGGILTWSEQGWNDNTLILILFGAIVFVFVVFGFFITICTESLPSRNSHSLPYSDRPPKYRETWRRQHLESCSQATDALQGTASLEPRTSTAMNTSRVDVRNLWESLVVPGVHQIPKRTASVSVVSEYQGRELERGRSNTVPHKMISDDGLPSYEEALRR